MPRSSRPFLPSSPAISRSRVSSMRVASPHSDGTDTVEQRNVRVVIMKTSSTDVGYGWANVQMPPAGSPIINEADFRIFKDIVLEAAGKCTSISEGAGYPCVARLHRGGGVKYYHSPMMTKSHSFRTCILAISSNSLSVILFRHHDRRASGGAKFCIVPSAQSGDTCTFNPQPQERYP